MNTFDVIFELIRCGLFGGQLSDSARAALSDAHFCKVVFIEARRHDVAHLLYHCLTKAGCALPEGEVLQKYQNEQFKAVFRVEQLNYEVGQICATLDSAGVDFILLKGSVLRKSYPEEWMRTSCDVDVLIKEADAERAKAALESSIGYVFTERSEYDLHFNAPSGNHLELHFTLEEMHPLTAEAADILNTVWEYTVPIGGLTHGYKMNDVMYYFFHVYHLAKHIKVGGGCGIKPFLDIMFIENKSDTPEIGALLEKGGLLKAAVLSEKLTEVWFVGGEHTTGTRSVSEFVLNGGVYGSTNNRVVLSRGLGDGKIKYFFSRIFLPYEYMRFRYPELEQKKCLYGPYQVRRWFDIIFREGKAKSSLRELKTNSDLSAEEIEAVAAMWRELGI